MRRVTVITSQRVYPESGAQDHGWTSAVQDVLSNDTILRQTGLNRQELEQYLQVLGSREMPIEIYNEETKTLSVEQFNDLHMFRYSQKKVQLYNQSTCSICIDQFKSNQKICALSCDHIFHKKCVERWLTREEASCPVCKKNINK